MRENEGVCDCISYDIIFIYCSFGYIYFFLNSVSNIVREVFVFLEVELGFWEVLSVVLAFSYFFY